jgi:hypothetical protein
MFLPPAARLMTYIHSILTAASLGVSRPVLIFRAKV